MSEHHRGAWDTRGDAVWWPGSLATQDQQTLHHQHLINQHHQQQLAAQQQQQQQQLQQQQQQQQAAAAQQQQQQAQQQQAQQQQAAQQQQQQQHQVVVQQQQNQQQQSQQSHNDVARSNCTTSGVTTQQLFSYKMASSFQNPATTMAQVVATSNAGTASGYDYRLNMATAQAAAPGSQWWYAAAANSQMDANALQQHQQQQQNPQQQNVHNVNTPPTSVLNNVGSSDSGGVSNTFEQLYSTYLFNMLANQHLADQIQQQQQQQNHQNNQQQQQIQLQKQQHSTMIRGKADPKPRGRMTAYAFFVQTCREEHKKKHPEETVIFAEFSRKCAERWKTMLDKEKKRFHEMAEKDKARYDREMQNYVPPKGVIIGRGKKRKQNKDPNAPKRSLSAFFWFCNDERNKVKALNPEYGVGDIAKELGRKWSDVDPETKQKYELMAEKDKARYEREMTEYKQKGKIPMSAPSMQQQVQQQQAAAAAAAAQQQQQQAVAAAAAAQQLAQVVQQQQQAAQQQQDADGDDDEDVEDEENH